MLWWMAYGLFLVIYEVYLQIQFRYLTSFEFYLETCVVLKSLLANCFSFKGS